MSKKAVFCISSSEAQASTIVGQLKTAGFSNNDISALLPDKTGTNDFAHEHHTKAPEGATTGGIIGGAALAVVGGLVGAGVLVVPALTPFAAAGAAMSALSGGAIGVGLGGTIGALVGWTRPEYEAKRYAGKIREGNILISVHCEKDGAVRRAKAVFQEAGAYNIGTSRVATVKAIGKPSFQPATAE